MKSIAKHSKSAKRQKGQFLTPGHLSSKIISSINLRPGDKILEPGFGDGSFIIPIVKKLLAHGLTIDEIFSNNIYGVEIDKHLYNKCISRIKSEFGYLPANHHLINDDFLLTNEINKIQFNYIIGNPPFGGTLPISKEHELDKKYGFRNGLKIKKETYAFFIIKSIEEHLEHKGHLVFICSNSFLTIKTMKGLRHHLMSLGKTNIITLSNFFSETKWPMVIISFTKSGPSNYIISDGRKISADDMHLTDNFSWNIPEKYVKYFRGPKLKEYITCTSGMTIGKNEYFVRKIIDNKITEPYKFVFFQERVSLRNELKKARYHTLSASKREKIKQLEDQQSTKKNVKILSRATPIEIKLPHPNYKYYNKATNSILYSCPNYAIFWKNGGEAVITFKKNGNWYLRGVGGMPFFEREGITWNLISSTLKVRYLPAGYILDSSAPCGFLNKDINQDELYFILAWLSTKTCNAILKNVINHTKNIQGKDVERLPYPYWITKINKTQVIEQTKKIIMGAQRENKNIQKDDIHKYLEEIESLFEII